MGWILYQAFSHDFASQIYKSLHLLHQIEVDEQVSYFAYAWSLVTDANLDCLCAREEDKFCFVIPLYSWR